MYAMEADSAGGGESFSGPDGIRERKRLLRRRMRALLRDFCADREACRRMSAAILETFVASSLFRDAPEIFGFLPLPQEVDLRAVFQAAFEAGKKVAVPRVSRRPDGTEAGEMDFYYLTADLPPERQTAAGAFGIPEPDAGAERADRTRIPASAVILTPALAFSRRGARLGRGGGFYDRYLSALSAFSPRGVPRPVVCGVCFSCQIADDIPLEPHDFSADFLLCETGLFRAG